ncbi:MAG: leucine dehydrogenase [Proteobacteria bacterium]|nr:leucine dehydrogenase [Pseudomonadota bacterium]
MDVIQNMMEYSHQSTHFFYHKSSGLKTIISIHDTTMGPALGGCRFFNYKSESHALEDALRLSRGMTYKSAVAGVPLGGGKSVIIGDHTHLRSRELFRAFGTFVNSLGGRYITSVDVNTTVQDLKWMHETTRYVTWPNESYGGSGDPSYMTAYGVYCGLKSALRHQLAKDSFAGVRIGVQGVGSVGELLCEHLHRDGAILTIADTHKARLAVVAKKFGAKTVAPNDIYKADVDIFVPCAMGGVLSDDTIPHIKAKIIGGAANNQLLEDRHGALLRDLGILYCPDYVINAGGIINVYYALRDSTDGFNAKHVEKARKHTAEIEGTLDHIFTVSSRDGVLPHEAASLIAREKLEQARKSQSQS